eukprot:CAMPEP_0177634682 /NCGR_PEP_ID=MMETSP0447-20121125/3497_1 /TAXON_ID=0 /ORGANISM="Stygamoeba regulata, Strain BSH-02190019" /LENGTH=61 /DNA_ID=CAMNT_0019136417 /DNA_START=842 /DNA_END=1024 /DNA_ORIENTATION=+
MAPLHFQHTSSCVSNVPCGGVPPSPDGLLALFREPSSILAVAHASQNTRCSKGKNVPVSST